ncbi:MAG: hypothetical protein M1835_002005 [Candelina submexicana]|nr:MAG: hypothetical protein M1835_002005 [Candelina submexicana]
MPLGVWKNREFCLLMGILTLGFMAFFSSSFFLALYLQRVKQYSALETAVHLLPLAIMGVIVNIVAGLILHKVSNKLLVAIGALAYTAAFLLLALEKESTSYWAMTFPSLCLIVIGADLEFNVSNMYVMSSLPPHQQSIAGGIFNTVTRLCVTIGLGISTAVFNAIAQSTTTSSPAGASSGAEDALKPYTAVYWFAVASAGSSLLLVPWLRIGTQGATKSADEALGDTGLQPGGQPIAEGPVERTVVSK